MTYEPNSRPALVTPPKKAPAKKKVVADKGDKTPKKPKKKTKK